MFPNLSINCCFPASSIDLTKSGSITVSLITSLVVTLFVGSSAEAVCVLMKYIVAIVGLPNHQRLLLMLSYCKFPD